MKNESTIFQNRQNPLREKYEQRANPVSFQPIPLFWDVPGPQKGAPRAEKGLPRRPEELSETLFRPARDRGAGGAAQEGGNTVHSRKSEPPPGCVLNHAYPSAPGPPTPLLKHFRKKGLLKTHLPLTHTPPCPPGSADTYWPAATAADPEKKLQPPTVRRGDFPTCRLPTCALVRSFVPALPRPFPHSLIRACVRSFARSFVRSFVRAVLALSTVLNVARPWIFELKNGSKIAF